MLRWGSFHGCATLLAVSFVATSRPSVAQGTPASAASTGAASPGSAVSPDTSPAARLARLESEMQTREQQNALQIASLTAALNQLQTNVGNGAPLTQVRSAVQT